METVCFLFDAHQDIMASEKTAATKKKSNPAADPRKMRRIIAEDPDWNLETVPPLVDACITHIANNFHEQPLLDELLPKHQSKVLSQLSTELPLEVTSSLISDEEYWERCCRARWHLCDVSDYDHNWKRMFFERNAQEAVETFVPNQSDIKQLEELLKLSSPFVKTVTVRQLLPPPQDQMLADDDEGDAMSEDASLKASNDHLDTGVILKNLRQLDELHLTFGVQNCGMNFNWSLFDFTAVDCQLLAKGLKTTPTLKVLQLTQSKATDERGRLIVAHLLDHPALRTLDLSHNKLGDGTGRAIGKLINERCPCLTVLNLSNNLIEAIGGVSIGHALQNNGTLKELNLRMNNLCDEGVQPIFKALFKNTTLVSLNVGSNNIGESSAPILSEVLMANNTLTSINITCNKLEETGGKLLQEGMEDNQTIVNFDLRLTDISQESEYCINRIVKSNQDRLAKQGT